jgi:hypothetical protein
MKNKPAGTELQNMTNYCRKETEAEYFLQNDFSPFASICIRIVIAANTLVAKQ